MSRPKLMRDHHVYEVLDLIVEFHKANGRPPRRSDGESWRVLCGRLNHRRIEGQPPECRTLKQLYERCLDGVGDEWAFSDKATGIPLRPWEWGLADTSFDRIQRSIALSPAALYDAIHVVGVWWAVPDGDYTLSGEEMIDLMGEALGLPEDIFLRDVKGPYLIVTVAKGKIVDAVAV